MKIILDMLTDGDLCSLGLLILILTFVGQKMAAPSPWAYRWSWHIASAVFVLFCGWGYLFYSPTDAQVLAWIAFRGLFAAGLALGVSWIVLSMVVVAYRHTLGPFFEKAEDWAYASRRRAEDRRNRRDEEHRRRLAQEEWERREPERQRARQEAEENARRQGEAQRRREDVRATCELLFSLYAPEIAKRFPRQSFDDFMKKYLGDNHAPEYVEERAQHLRDLIQQHVERVEPSSKVTSIEALGRWYEDQKSVIENTVKEQRARETHLALLLRRYHEAMKKLLEETQL